MGDSCGYGRGYQVVNKFHKGMYANSLGFLILAFIKSNNSKILQLELKKSSNQHTSPLYFFSLLKQIVKSKSRKCSNQQIPLTILLHYLMLMQLELKKNAQFGLFAILHLVALMQCFVCKN